MRQITALLVLLICINIAAAGKNYKRLEFRRDGGGNKEFFISKSDFEKSITINITRFNFKDSVFTINLTQSEAVNELIELLKSLFKGSLNIKGNYKQTKLLTGTWAHFYMIGKDNTKHEILNKKLRDKLLELETLVEQKIKK